MKKTWNDNLLSAAPLGGGGALCVLHQYGEPPNMVKAKSAE